MIRDQRRRRRRLLRVPSLKESLRLLILDGEGLLTEDQLNDLDEAVACKDELSGSDLVVLANVISGEDLVGDDTYILTAVNI